MYFINSFYFIFFSKRERMSRKRVLLMQKKCVSTSERIWLGIRGGG